MNWKDKRLWALILIISIIFVSGCIKSTGSGDKSTGEIQTFQDKGIHIKYNTSEWKLNEPEEEFKKSGNYTKLFSLYSRSPGVFMMLQYNSNPQNLNSSELMDHIKGWGQFKLDEKTTESHPKINLNIIEENHTDNSASLTWEYGYGDGDRTETVRVFLCGEKLFNLHISYSYTYENIPKVHKKRVKSLMDSLTCLN